MERNIFFIGLISAVIINTFFLIKGNSCEKVEVLEDELPGLYIMTYKNILIDTLVINKDHTFYHSYKNLKSKDGYTKNGTWKYIVDGYYELLNYSSATIVNSWDMKPYKCSKGGEIFIEKSYDGAEMYRKWGSVSE